MARSLIQRRQDARRERDAVFDATLRCVFAPARQPPDCERALREAREGLDSPVRDPSEWRPQLKTRDPARLRLAAARHLFALYPVPSPLERIWLDSTGLEADEVQLRKRWYAVVAGGGSLYKLGAAKWLSRKEVHWFLHPPGELSFEQAFWQAVARSYTEDMGIVLRIARSKIAGMPRDSFEFWREAARFFCLNPVAVEEIEDFCDFLVFSREQDAGYSLHGRTLSSLRRQMVEWHVDLAAIQRIEAQQRAALRARLRHGDVLPDDGAWRGSTLPDWSWRPSSGGRSAQKEEFVAIQLKTAAGLIAESRAMRHCVWTYAAKCVAGQASIWSLRRNEKARTDRMLTVELDSRNRAVQVRGVANRLPRPEEEAILGRWFKAQGISLLQCRPH